MKLSNMQLAQARKKRETFEGQIEEVAVIRHGEESLQDALTFALETFLDPDIDYGVIIADGSSFVVTSPDVYKLSVSKGYGITKDVKPIILPAAPDNTWVGMQGHRKFYTNASWKLTADASGDIPSLITGTYYVSLAYKEYSTYMGSAVADYTPANVKYYHNFFLRIGTSENDASAKGSDGSTGSNANDVFIAKIQFNAISGAITVDSSYVKKYISSVVSSASKAVWVAHKQQSHINGIMPPYSDRISASYPSNNTTLEPSIKGTGTVDKRTVVFQDRKSVV